MKHVTILQHRLLHYRTEFFSRLRERCFAKGIQVDLVHGQASRRELGKKDVGYLSWATQVTNRFVEIGARDILWQPYPRALSATDLLIVMQESRILSNYPHLLSRCWSQRKVAYWGHGVNFQSEAPDGLRERWKRMMLSRVDWWFAYTDMTRDIVRAQGFPNDRITVLDNAIDNESFRRELATVPDDEVATIRSSLGIAERSPVGLFCGSLYVDKRLEFMISAADRIRERIPDFSLVVVGDGPSADDVRAAAISRPWLHCVGVKKGHDKAAYFRLASVVFNPGAVGLHVLDAFCAGVPMATTRDAKHGPEIAYLEDGVNGINTEGEIASYADAVIALLNDKDLYLGIQRAALEAANRYTLNNMVNRFCDGIEACLEAPKKS